MEHRILKLAIGLFLATEISIAFCIEEPSHQITQPNVVLIYADDLGYGDVGCYDSRSKIPTPNIDHLAARGICFTNAHASDTICSPSRYGILTGHYSWRTSRKKGNPPPGIQPWLAPGRLTMPQM
jgi:arylsulfatase A